MKFTSKGCKKKLFFLLSLLATQTILIHIQPSFLRAEGTDKKSIILFEFSQTNIGDESARRYFDGLNIYLGEILSLDIIKASTLRKKEEGPEELFFVPSETVHLWKEKLIKGKQYFKYIEVEQGEDELHELIESPYRFHLEGKSLALVNEGTLSYAFILFKTGRLKESEKLIARYVYLSGNESVADQIFPPDFVRFFNEISSKHHPVALALNSTPASADVLLDGKSIGKTPLFQKIERYGLISLSFRKKGFIGYRFNRVVMPGDRVNLDLDMEIDEISEVESFVQKGEYEEVAKSVKRIISRRELDGGFVVVLKGEKKPSSIDYIVSERIENEEKINFAIHRDIIIASDSFHERDLGSLFRDDLFLSFLPSTKKMEPYGDGYKKKKLTEKWYFWAIIGVGAVGLVYAISRGGDSSGGSVNIEF